MDSTKNRLRAFLLVVATMLFIPGGVALATVEPPPPGADAGTVTDLTWMSLNASTVLWVTAVLIPLIGGVILRTGASRTTQTAVGLVLNAVNALVVTATTEGGNAILTETLVTNFLMSLVISIATLYGVWKPLGTDAALVSKGGVIG